MNFMQHEVTKWGKIRHKTYQNTQICYERETWENTSLEDFLEVVWKTSWMSSGRPPGCRLEDFLQVVWKSSSTEVFQIWKTCISKSRSEKPAYPKTFKWLENIENEYMFAFQIKFWVIFGKNPKIPLNSYKYFISSYYFSKFFCL